MFTENATSRLPFGAIAIHRFLTAIEQPVRAFSSWRTERQTRKALSNLSDHQLVDIGLDPSDFR